MGLTTIAYRFLLRGGLASALASLNETPLARELIVATNARNFKLGNGASAFNSLPWLLVPWTTASGTDTITATYTDKPVYFDGMMVRLRAAGANTGAVTFNPNGLGALAVKKRGGQALIAGEIAGADHELLLVFRDSGTDWWELLNPAPVANQIALADAGNYFSTDNVEEALQELASGSVYGGSMALMGTVTVTGSASSSMVLSGLDLAADGHYMLAYSLKNNTVTSTFALLRYNSDTTTTNYYSILGGFARANNPSIAGFDSSTNCTGVIHIRRDIDGRARATGVNNRGNPSAMSAENWWHAWNTTNNVTSIEIACATASFFAVGSTFKVWKIN